ncbi:MAG: SsrA-binding protein SmpB [Peptococcaceae bacterium]|nr:SsrA-binding protein SmpB [Peptococcaceae bacterium]MBT9135858.1 SsrA-binding protein [Bacillota bacterium]MBT9152848.1 SsrA-binding protein [Bacillota bacterium]MBT9157136.1 SsrA-binding protein [Bacillota bacterium]
MTKQEKDKEKLFADNRKAYHDYFIDETYEAGLALAGTEVKSIRKGKANLRDSYAAIVDGECYLINAHISPYDQGNQFNHEPRRQRKLLLHKREINRLIGLTMQKGYTLVALRLYQKRGKIKVALGLARGKKVHDKREAEADKEAKRDIEQAFRLRQKGEA